MSKVPNIKINPELFYGTSGVENSLELRHTCRFKRSDRIGFDHSRC